MEYSHRLAISYYKTIATVNEEHNVFLVQHQENKKICIKKIMDVYNADIYHYFRFNNITGIPKIFDIYEENDQLIVIEEYISGTSLQEMLNPSVLNMDQILHYMCELCDILGKIHLLNPPIVHRDIKPSNIIITPCGHVMLIDFNAAKYLTNKDNSDTVLLGTKGYAAPEQYGFGSSTPQTDIYALGILLKELTAALPESTNIFDSITNKCTQINPSDRFKDVYALKQALVQCGPAGKNTSQVKEPLTWRSFLPPGYRTFTPWKMAVASVVYLFIFWLSLSLEAQDATVCETWIERICCLLMMLAIIFGSFNYCDVQRFVPLCKNRHRLLRYLGILLFDLYLMWLVLFVMVILLSIF